MIKDASADPKFVEFLEAALLIDLRDLTDQGTNSSINLALHDPNGALLAGLVGATSYGWLCVKMLWVLGCDRRAGLGTDLMRKAMELSISRGCHSAWLETSNPAARAFYEKLGFEVFAMLANNTDTALPNHQRWFLQRALSPSS